MKDTRLKTNNFHLFHNQGLKESLTMYSDSSDEEFEEDPNVPKDVECCEGESDHPDDLSSIGAMSGQYLRDLEVSGCRPDLAEVANMTINVNYGDLANMASCPVQSRTKIALLIDPALTAEADANLTWSQMLDIDQKPQNGSPGEQATFAWNQGYDETCSLSGAALTLSNSERSDVVMSRRQSDCSALSLSRLPRRPRPLSALKRFLSRRTIGRGAKTTSESFRTRGTPLTMTTEVPTFRVWNTPRAA